MNYKKSEIRKRKFESPNPKPQFKILSGGQTGADRAALDFALENGFKSGGFVPKGRRAEDGPISEIYQNLVETKTRNYAERTELNILAADLTIVLSPGELSGGSLLTRKLAEQHHKPYLHIDFMKSGLNESAAITREWLFTHKFKIINIAGSRASTDPGIYDRTKEFLEGVFNRDSEIVQ